MFLANIQFFNLTCHRNIFHMSKNILISHSSTNVSSPPIRHLLYGKRNFILYHFMAMLHTKRITLILSPFFYTTIIIALNFEIFHLENQPSNKKNSTENSAATKKINLKPCYSKISPSKLSWSAWNVLFTHSHTPARKDSSDWKCRVAGLSFHEKWTDYTNTRWKVRPASHSMHYDISVYLFALPFLFFQTRYVSTSSRFIRNIVKETVVRGNTNEENQ